MSLTNTNFNLLCDVTKVIGIWIKIIMSTDCNLVINKLLHNDTQLHTIKPS